VLHKPSLNIKMKITTCFLALFMAMFLSVQAQNEQQTAVNFLQDEYWWGGLVAMGSQMPFIKPINEIDLEKVNLNNQTSAFFVSNKGRYIWSDQPFRFEVKDKAIHIKSRFEKVSVNQSGNTLRDAYLGACKNHFSLTNTLPDPLLFSQPQYNTWIELMYNQNEKDILHYAQSILDNGFPPGVLMIDDNWQRYYGNFDFRAEKFDDPKGMIDKLHNMGFKIMVWISPFVSADTQEYRELHEKGYLLKEKISGSPAILEWWNGKSACYDLTNPEAFDYFVSILKKAQQKYGIDGFKLDAGDPIIYKMENIDSYKKDATSNDHCKAWAQVGLNFPFNEYRACWQMQGQPLVQRLGDKDYSWETLQLLIPDMITAGLLGYAYISPDMIGGGQFTAFMNIDSDKFDQNLIVRSAQIHALMPMMQFSVAPWRILNKENLAAVKKAALLHEKFGAYILDYAKESAKTGEPIVRHMEYAFPNQGFETCNDQFMLGTKYLIAPVVDKGFSRSVKLPKGEWVDELGKKYKGGKEYTIEVPIERLPYFEKKK